MFKQIFNHLFINIYLQTFRYDCGKEVVSQNFVVGNQRNRLERDGSIEYPEQIFEQLFDHIFLESTYIFHDILIHECGKFFSTYACVFGNPTKICVVGNQRNRLSGMVPMSTQNKCLNKCLTIFYGIDLYILPAFYCECRKEIVNQRICVVGNQRNHLDEMIPMSTQNKCWSGYLAN